MALTLCKHARKVDCDVKSDLEPQQVLKPIKWQDLLEKGKSGSNAFSTGAKIYVYSEKNILALGGT